LDNEAKRRRQVHQLAIERVHESLQVRAQEQQEQKVARSLRTKRRRELFGQQLQAAGEMKSTFDGQKRQRPILDKKAAKEGRTMLRPYKRDKSGAMS
jgi:hypothetical protein